MHILYLDESGTHDARYFVVAGIAVFERSTYYLARELDRLQSRYFPDHAGAIPFHASALHAPDDRVPAPFDLLPRSQRRNLLRDIYQVIADSTVRIFAVAMEKAAVPESPYERGFEEIVSRFDRMLVRIHREQDEQQRGLIVVAESSYRENLETLARRIAAEGHRWGDIHNLADIPYFAPANNTRLLQLADFVSNAVFGRYESGYARYFDQIAARFDQDQERRLHGLVHLARDRRDCYCLACANRRVSSRAYPEDPAAGD